jgi:hypothetical protein
MFTERLRHVSLMAIPLEPAGSIPRLLLDMTQIRLRVREMTKEIPLQDQGGDRARASDQSSGPNGAIHEAT